MQRLTAEELETAIRAARRDAAARDRLLEHYRPYLKLLAVQSLNAEVRRREDASDVVQQTLFEAAETVAGFNGGSEGEFCAWITRILQRNVADAMRDHRAAKRDVRREQRVERGDDSATISWQWPEPEPTSPSVRILRAETALSLAHGLERLPADQRQAVMMRHLEGLPLVEIAAAMNKTPAAVAGLLRRGVIRLREEMADSSL